MSYRVRVTFPSGATGVLASTCPTREEALRLILELQKETGLAYVVEEVVPTAAVPDATPEPTTPEVRIRELEAELAHLRDAYDAAREELDVAKRKVKEVKATAAMLEADLFTERESAKVAWARSQMASCKTVGFMVRLDRALELGDAMYLALTTAQPYLAGHGTMGEWEAYKHTLAASRQSPAKASEAPGEGHHSGEGAK